MIWLRLAFAAGLFAFGCAAGWYATSGHYEGQLAAAERKATERRIAAAADGERLAAELRMEIAERSRTTTTLLERQRHARIVSSTACQSAGTAHAATGGPDAAAGAAGVAGGVAGGRSGLGGGESAGADGAVAGNGLAVPDALGAPGQGAADAEPRITLGALSLWNSALAGEFVPAGACRLDAPSGLACAVDSSVTLSDAWSNHTVNASSCAEDRARHKRLIEFSQLQQQRRP